MQRRHFLQNALTGALALTQGPMLLAQNAVSGTTALPAQNPAAGLRGVNLGAWLVLEKWMTPSVFQGTNAADEYSLCMELGKAAAARLKRHRETFITAEDFRWIKARGLNAIRLPVGFWALQATAPWIECAPFVDFAFEQARKNGLKVLLDLHGAPGSQNAWDHSGRSGTLGWHTNKQNIKKAIEAIEGLAKRYGQHPSLAGIELLNEPRWDVPLDILKNYYQDAYKSVRLNADNRVFVVVHDGFRPFEWKNFMAGPEYSNVILDTHLYQAYTDDDRKRTAQEHIAFALNRKAHLDAMSQQLPTMVGEWSIATPPEVWRGQSPFQIEAAKRAYGGAQLLSYENTQGWFYWSYKLEDKSDWNFRYCVERGWLPDNFGT